MSPLAQLLNERVAAEAGSDHADWPVYQTAPRAASARVAREIGSLAMQSRAAHAYNEHAFQYFLEIERKRSELSNRPFLLMLVDFRHPGIQPRIDSATADKLFSVLSLSLRETDFVGWYREDRVAGAVLTQDGETDDDLSELVRKRIGTAIASRLPAHLSDRLQVRVYQLPRNGSVQGD
jgi:hypothetical protein